MREYQSKLRRTYIGQDEIHACGRLVVLETIQIVTEPSDMSNLDESRHGSSGHTLQ
jgi:hypothetical protein